jgi:hypothetical protein
MTALAVREDLNQRTALSKSALNVADLCGMKAWLEIHHRRPLILVPDLVFGSAVDAAVEQVLKATAAGIPLGAARPMEAAAEIVERDGIEIHMEEVEAAIVDFVRDILPAHDWTECVLQAHLNVVMDGWGECDGHPDIVLRSDACWDVKTSKRAKETARTVELGLYALMIEATTGRPVPEIGYLTRVRTKTPTWQTLSTPVTDEFRDWTRERVDAFVRAKRADVLLNRNAVEPVNWTFPSGPKNGGLCRTCQYNPMFGGACRMAVRDPLPAGGDEA